MTVTLYEDAVLIFLNDRAGFAQLCRNALKVLGDDVLDKNLAAGGRRGCHIGSRLNLVGNNGIAAAVKPVNSVDLYRIRTCSANIRAHGV